MTIRSLVTLCALLTTLAPLPDLSAGEASSDTIKRLPESRHTLIEAIHQAEKSNGTAISAKFEFEEGKLWLSVYTAKDGKTRDAEHNTLLELKGEPNGTHWQPKTEVFQDKEHIARSAAQLTVLQVSAFSLEESIQRAAAAQKGTVYSAIPAVKAGKAVVEILLATSDGKSAAVDVDLLTGRATKR